MRKLLFLGNPVRSRGFAATRTVGREVTARSETEWAGPAATSLEY